MKLKNLIIAGSVIASMALTGCNQATNNGFPEDPDGPGLKVYVDIVTLETTGTSGTSLVIQSKDDAPKVTYFSTQMLPETEFHSGDRIVISYTPTSNDRYQNGPISIYEAMKTFGAGVRPYPKTALQTQEWKSDPVEVYELHRSGDYVNIILNAEALYSDVDVELVLDAATAESEVPEYYVLFKRKNQNVATQEYAYYLSYSIADQWKREDVTALRFKYVDPKLGAIYKDIKKVLPDTPKPAN